MLVVGFTGKTGIYILFSTVEYTTSHPSPERSGTDIYLFNIYNIEYHSNSTCPRKNIGSAVRKYSLLEKKRFFNLIKGVCYKNDESQRSGLLDKIARLVIAYGDTDV
jgi:hypothetical protein